MSEINKHIIIIDNEFFCNICNNKSANRKTLRNHIRDVHNIDVKLFKCDSCDKKYKTSRGLKSHKTRKHDVPTAPKLDQNETYDSPPPMYMPQPQSQPQSQPNVYVQSQSQSQSQPQPNVYAHPPPQPYNTIPEHVTTYIIEKKPDNYKLNTAVFVGMYMAFYVTYIAILSLTIGLSFVTVVTGILAAFVVFIVEFMIRPVSWAINIIYCATRTPGIHFVHRLVDIILPGWMLCYTLNRKKIID